MDLLCDTVQPYAWGSRTPLPGLMGVPPTGAPRAETGYAREHAFGVPLDALGRNYRDDQN
ncbi:hypothetical protein [Streptomyces sp. NPDC085479]|uniref:hypothetical protein n=1 Tax=Streptomyces sp. NPDC085479 TaxID=3365726 RepID=UPI0037D7611C